MQGIKEILVNAGREKLGARIQALHQALEEIEESMTAETKSSAGDKHETARARMQFEQEKLGKQLEELALQQQELARIDLTVPHQTIGFGSLVTTSRGRFFIAVALGKLTAEQQEVYAVSPLSPLALVMKGLAPGAVFRFNSLDYHVLSLL